MISEAFPYQHCIHSYFQAFAEEDSCFLFDSGKPHQQQGRFDFFSAYPTQRLTSDGSDIDEIKKKLALTTNNEQFPELPFTGGWMGFASYELGYFLEKNAGDGLKGAELPLFWSGFYQWTFTLDHEKKEAFLIYDEKMSETLVSRIKRLLLISQQENTGTFTLKKTFTPLSTWQQYEKNFNTIQNYLAAGDCYQVNYAQAYEAPFVGPSYEAFQLLRNTVPSPFMVYANLGDQQILSISPERFIKAYGSKVQSKPIKGTAKRSDNQMLDAQIASSLQQSQKNRAENVMIVDLIRNDFGQLCTVGSVKVDELFAIESYANVHHLVSTISAEIGPGKTIWDLFFAAFPGGSITGAPKIRACQIINELEQQRRDIYCGSLFYASNNGHFDSNIAIRTLLAQNNTLTAWAGGGIIKDSTANEEYEECQHKISRLLNVLNDTIKQDQS